MTRSLHENFRLVTPDYRFSLANERTYLADPYRATFTPASVLISSRPICATPLIREVLALLLYLFAGVLAITAICAGCVTKRRCA